MILTPLQKLPNNAGDLGKIFDATSFECLPKKQKIAQFGHTGMRGVSSVKPQQTFLLLHLLIK